MDSLKTHPQVHPFLEKLWRKDPDTYSHCHRVADLSQWLGKEMGLSSQERVEVYLCGLLHDIGKILTPDAILKKPGPLTPAEFGIMKLHPMDSGRMVDQISDIGYLAEPIRHHHERIDGKGYPHALKDTQIPIYSKIVLVADTFDAMTNNRVYRKQLDLGRTYDELRRCSGTQFDPEAVQAFIRMHERFAKSFDFNKVAA
jgi:HD-GYP domain-containing protein (c-di-GMP phosphodiesterase class II)